MNITGKHLSQWGLPSGPVYKEVLKAMRFVVMSTIMVFVSGIALAIELEPDWPMRYEQVKTEEISKWSGPKVGDRVTVIRRVGGECSGTISKMTRQTVTIDSKTFSTAQLTPESCKGIFAASYAASAARERVTAERGNYKTRWQNEYQRTLRQERQLKIDAENARRRRLTQQQRSQQIAKTQKQRSQQIAKVQKQQELELKAKNMAIGIVVLVIIACIFGSMLYIVPSVIAFKRGHQNAGAILALNLLLGWSFAGWVAALVWSLTQVVATSQPQSHRTTMPLTRTDGKRIVIRRRQGKQREDESGKVS